MRELVCVSASVGGAGGQIYAPCTGEMKAVSQAGHSSLFFLFLWLGSAGWRRSSLISSEPTGLFFHLRIPSFSPPPTKSPLSYSLPLQLPHRLSAESASPQSAVSLSSSCPLSPAAEVSNLSERQSLGPALLRLPCVLNNTAIFFPPFLRKLDGSHKLILL